MQCSQCQFQNPAGMRYCGNCAAPLASLCTACHQQNPQTFKYCGFCGQALPVLPLVSAATGSSSTAAGEAEQQMDVTTSKTLLERRQLTVMFVDLVGSSELSERLDPEDLREIITIYRDKCHQVISRYSGYIAQYLGDGILVYFGYPIAGEDDPCRAVHVALEITGIFKKLKTTLLNQFKVRVRVRIGIHTGLVIIGEQTSTESDRLALGETPNIAARLQAMAQPDNICISNVTRSLVADEFQCISLGTHTPKGFTQALEIFEVRGETDFFQRQTTRTRFPCTPLIGREQECGLMQDRLERAIEGIGQAVYVTGEAGIGKTRLIQEIHERLTVEKHLYIEIQGVSHYRNSPFHAVINYLNRAFNLGCELSIEAKREKVANVFAKYQLGSDRELALTCDLLGIPHEFGDVSSAALPSQIRKRNIITALFHMLQKMAEGKLLVIIVDDVQWLDPSTLELVGMMVDQASLWRMFVLLAFRNDYQLPWKAHSYVTHITLNRLPPKQAARLINALGNDKQLPDEIFQDIIQKTDGIPLFVEELMKMILASGKLIERGNRYELADMLYAVNIPVTLQDSLMASLDKLGADKELAQLIATLGREFIYDFLRAVVSMDEEKLQRQLSGLVSSELLQQRGLPPNASYCFRQALLQETAYQSLLKSTRMNYHRRIAGIIHDQFPDKIENQPEVYAHHLTEAGELAAAVNYWVQAGKFALQRYANLEAISHFNKGLELLHQLPQTRESMHQELHCLTALGQVLIMYKGYTSFKAARVFSQARKLCEKMPQNHQTFQVLAGLWRYYYTRGKLTRARRIAERLREISTRIQDPLLHIEADRIMGCTLFWLGEYIPANQFLQSGLQTIHRSNTLEFSGEDYSQDPCVANFANAALVQWFLGEQQQALHVAQEGITLARALQHPFSIVYALIFATIVSELADDKQQSKLLIDEAMSLAEYYGFGYWLAIGRMLQAWIYRQTGLEEAIQIFDSTMTSFRQNGGNLAMTYFLSLLAQMHLQAGNFDLAGSKINTAIALAENSEEKFYYPELLRLKAVIMGATGDDANELISECLDSAKQLISSSGGVALAGRLQSTIDSTFHSAPPDRYH